MFVSQPQYEFPFPPDLERPGSQHWRMVELTLHMPWFLLSVEVVDAELPDCGLTRTICIAWDFDLCEVLQSLEAGSVMGIVCMMPAWQSPNGLWSSREIREVWLHTSEAGRSVVLRDADGQQFDCGLVPEHVSPVHKELVLRVAPAQPRRREGSQRKSSPPDNRRARRAVARKADA
jgi:hypothetical protein